VEGGGGGLTMSGVSRNSGGFVKCVAIQKRLGIPGLYNKEPDTSVYISFEKKFEKLPLV
jgi:hypothetical protein